MAANFLQDFYLWYFVNLCTLLNPTQLIQRQSFLLGGYIVFANEEKGSCSIKSFPDKHETIDEI